MAHHRPYKTRSRSDTLARMRNSRETVGVRVWMLRLPRGLALQWVEGGTGTNRASTNLRPLPPTQLPTPTRGPWPPLMRVALRHLPRRQFWLLPTLDRAVLADDRAEVHAGLRQRPHRRVSRTTYPPFCARPQQCLAGRSLRPTALSAPGFQLDGDQFPTIQNQHIGHAGV